MIIRIIGLGKIKSIDYLKFKIDELSKLNLNYLNIYQTLNPDYSYFLNHAENKMKVVLYQELEKLLSENPNQYIQQLSLQVKKDITFARYLPVNDPYKYIVERRINILNNELKNKFRI